MNNFFEEGKLTIYLDGRLSAGNAAAIREEIYSLLEQYKPEKVVIDCETLEYISSSGLRVLLEIGKSYSMSVTNVSGPVYEILDLSGFTSMFDIKHAMRRLSVEGCEMIGTGASSHVYKYDEDTMLKKFVQGVSLDRIYAETESARKSFIAGIQTSIPFDVVKCDDWYATAFEMIDGSSLNSTFVDHPERFDELTEKYVELLKQFHSTEAAAGSFPDIRDKYHSWMENLSNYMTEEEVASLYDAFDAIPPRNTMIHVDPHGGNIMVDGGKLLFVDMADISIGHPLVDVGTEYFHYVILRETSLGAKLIFTVEPEDSELPLRIWNELERRYFEGKSDAQMKDIHRMLQLFGGLRCLIIVAKHKQLAEEVKKELVEKQRKELMPFIAEAKELFARADEFFN
ncbi:MAG: STAS domain-containing protein [Lachnospiraceae bacterium]|nr:STAS domain-containing protein [Lachnospiraceae bacterium]